MALDVIAHARQPRSHHPVWVKPVPTKLVSTNLRSPSHHADRCNHGSSSTASCGSPRACPCLRLRSNSHGHRHVTWHAIDVARRIAIGPCIRQGPHGHRSRPPLGHKRPAAATSLLQRAGISALARPPALIAPCALVSAHPTMKWQACGNRLSLTRPVLPEIRQGALNCAATRRTARSFPHAAS